MSANSPSSSSVAEILPLLRAELSKLRIPSAQDKVYKDECVYSFDSPFSETGLYVNLLTLQGVGRDFLSLDAKKTHCRLYLHELWTQTQTPVKDKETTENTSLEEEKEEKERENEKKEPSKLAIGLPGGFPGEAQRETEKRHALVLLDSAGDAIRASLPLPCPELPEFLSNVLQAIIDHQGMKSALAVSTWDADNEKIVSKYALSLEQVNPQGIRISQNPRDWKDAASDATDNLWLNLSTGYIGGGRRNWDGTGGSGSALQHYLDTGKKYPLVVKLGTITPHGADVWSYAEEEDTLVVDPLLAEHLSFWGIDIMKLEKTDKSLSEMEVSLNMTYDWSKIMEGQESLIPMHGAHFVGLRNIGSSCYMNAMLQALFAIPEVQERYLVLRDSITQHSSDPTTDLMAQLSKVAQALLTDRYVPPESERAEEKKSEETSLGEIAGDVETLEKYVIAPRMLKAIVGKNHADFSSGRQQDVYEYYCHLLECIQRAEHVNLSKILPEHLQSLSSAAKPTTSIFEFQQEIKFKALDSPEVKFTPLGAATLANSVSLQIPLDKAEKVIEEKEREREDESKQESKRARVEDEQKPSSMPVVAEEQLRVSFEACLESTFSPGTVSLRHPTTGAPTTFSQTTRFASFPRYLVLKLNRYYVGENWTPKKISAEVPMPEKMDLSQYKAEGLLPGEIELQDNSSSDAAAAAFVVDESLVEQLVMMGFSENGCRRAAIATRNADPETAMNWILEHMEDADFNDPPVLPESTASSALPAVDEEQVMLLSSMGFTAEQATAALIATSNNVERAADWLFSRADTLDADVANVLNQKSSTSSSSTAAVHSLEQGEGKYTLMAIISHIGKNTEHGHYVVHIRKQNEWVLFNDEKVGKSEKPPLGFGYMYIYRRDDSPGTLFI